MATCVLWPSIAGAQLRPCEHDAQRIADAIARIESSIDPCGQSAEVLEVLDQARTCRLATYEVCTDTAAVRNVFDRLEPRNGVRPVRTITWNPNLRTDLEPACSGDASAPLQRDPTASLLHELVHAAQDCRGLNPGDHELDAVRIENIYRRAAGLCERSAYGDIVLPASMTMDSCVVKSCFCSADEVPPPLPLHRAQSDPIAPLADGAISGDRPSDDRARPQQDGDPVLPRTNTASVGG